MGRLFVVSLALIASTGCFQADTHIVLAPDGSGTFKASSHFTPGAAKALRELDALQPEQHGLAKIEAALPHKPSAEEKKALAAAGLHDVKVKVEDSAKALGADLSLRFDAVGAIAALSTISGSDVPELTLVGSQGSSTLKLKTNPAPAATSDAPPAEISPEITEKATAIASGLMAEASSFRVVVTLEVPGDVTAATPDFAVVDGRTVTWTVDAAMMMARMGSLDPSKLGVDGYAATYATGVPIPTGAPAAPPAELE